ncbi:Uncharacterised protein [Neisseria animaloris]|uniref:Uncharacterized protein n=1 Tax=Neisseria animaloris TaxID=326522 RepID=A0A3S5BWG8_9NEIS|nr:Uncharacterised protein [Neisseria animaloris]
MIIITIMMITIVIMLEIIMMMDIMVDMVRDIMILFMVLILREALTTIPHPGDLHLSGGIVARLTEILPAKEMIMNQS